MGQRVRLVRPSQPVHNGITGTIKSLFPERPGKTHTLNCDVDWDSPLAHGTGSATHTSRLEPILAQRHEACDADFNRDLARLLERQGVLA